MELVDKSRDGSGLRRTTFVKDVGGAGSNWVCPVGHGDSLWILSTVSRGVFPNGSAGRPPVIHMFSTGCEVLVQG